MGIFNIFRKSKLSHYHDDKHFLINSDNDKSHAAVHDEKLNQILAELKAIYVIISQHDHHLTVVDNNIISHITELMVRKKEIPEGKKLEAENILKTAKDRAEAIEKLKSIGVSQATAYRYTEFFKDENEKPVIVAEKKESKTSQE
jgi:hypothetical protein